MNRTLFISLYPLYLVYLFVISIRNFLYNKKILKISKLSCKVISVGNVSMGGTGKTPMVISLTQQLQKKYKVAILSRGYGRRSKGTHIVTDGKTKSVDWHLTGDEPALMANKLNGIPIVVDENRIRGGSYLAARFNPDIIILDDAFQHRKIHRDIDIVLIDESKSVRGTFLREPFSSIKRANLVLLTKGVNGTVQSLKNQLSDKYDFPIHIVKTITEKYVINQTGKATNIENIEDKFALIFSGIGNNKSFYDTVKGCGISIIASMYFKDHHRYSAKDLKSIEVEYNKSDAEIILTTEKDLIKFPNTDLPVFAIPISMEIPIDVIDLTIT